MKSPEKFKVSAYLKNVIGRELVTDKFIAIFELVKNSIDAHATLIEIELNPEKNCMYIVDNGWGMSEEDIIKKWLFVAYSAKTDGAENIRRSNYRDRINDREHFAGSKGIGRFSCDTLGKKINLYSRTSFEKSKVSCLQVDWNKFESDDQTEFSEINVEIEDDANFPKLQKARLPSKSGTIIEILDLREKWDEADVKKLRENLAKLIDPFGSSQVESDICTYYVSANSKKSELNGVIKNDLTDILEKKTSHIHVEITKENTIYTELSDRGTPIFKISESGEISLPSDCVISADIYYLNKSAKNLFRKNMGMSSVKFGSIFLFLNGFRIFPIGEEIDDTFGLNRRKQQGFSRFLGTRDVLGRIDVSAPPGVFREVSSRDGGLIRDANYIELHDFILKKIVFPLEKYVVGVNWSSELPEEFKYGEEFIGFENDEAKMRILDIIGGYAKNKNVKLLDYNKNIVDIMDEKQNAIDKTLDDLLQDAQSNKNKSLAKRISQTKARIKELEKSEKSVQLLEKKVEDQKVEYESKVHMLEKQTKLLQSQNRFLEKGKSVNVNHLQDLLHHISIFTKPIRESAESGIKLSNKTLKTLTNKSKIEKDNLDDINYDICEHLKENRENFSSIHLHAKIIQKIAKYSRNIKIGLKNPRIVDDILKFLSEYFSEIKFSFTNTQVHFKSDSSEFVSKFSLYEIAVIIDNFVANSNNAGARNIWFDAEKDCAKKQLKIHVRDDGRGIDTKRIDTARIFEKHYTSTHNGTGLGLYQIKQIINEWGGEIELSPSPNQTRADFIITLEENKK